MLTSLFYLFYVTGEFHRFLHRGRVVGTGTNFVKGWKMLKAKIFQASG